MRRTDLVHVNWKPGIFANQRAAGSGVIHMNVRQQDGVQIAHGQSMRLQLLPKSLQCRTGARVNEHAMAFRFQQRRRDGPWLSHPLVVEYRELVHRIGVGRFAAA